MATNLDNRALSGIGATTDPTQYKAAFDGLKDSIDALQKPLSDINISVNTISKSLSNTTDAGDAFKKKVDDLSSSYSAWKNITDMLNLALGGTEKAITGGLALITTFAPQLVKWLADLTKGETALDSVTQKIKDNQTVMDAVNQVRQTGEKNAQKEIENLRMLYEAAQQLSKPEDRKKAADALKKQWSAEFKNYSQEIIMAGKAGDAIDQVTKAIIARSRAKEAENIIVKNKQIKVDDTQELAKLQTDLKQYQADVKKAQEELQGYRAPLIPGPVYTQDSTGGRLQNNLSAARRNVDDTNKAIAKLTHNINVLENENDRITDNTIKDTNELGTGVLGIKDNAIAKQNNSSNGTDKNKLQQSLNEAEQLQQDSITRQLQITTQGYSAELLQQDIQYKQQLTSLDNLLKNKLIKQDEYNTVKQQLESEHHAAVGALMDKFNAEDADKVQQATNELAELKIKGMKDGADKQTAELQQQAQEREQQYDKIEAENAERLKTIYAEIDKTRAADPNADISGLQALLDKQWQIINLNNEKRIEDEKQTTAAIKKIRDDAAGADARKASDKRLQSDQKAIDNAIPDDRQNAERQLVLDKYAFEIEQAKKTNQDIAGLEQQQNDELKAIDDKYAQQKADNARRQAQQLKNFELQTAQQVANSAFSVVKNSISQQADARVKQLEADKNSELANTNLTSAQKQAIQQDYQKKESAIKIKAFKDEQLASIGQALINGALAVTKATAQTGVLSAFAIPAIIAETAIQVAAISAQKPPAYARGGMHYQSDGRGGVLPGYSRTDNTNAYLRSGEGIVVSEAMRVPWARNLVSAINVGFGGRDFSMPAPARGFAVGGIFTDGGDANRYYNPAGTRSKELSQYYCLPDDQQLPSCLCGCKRH